MANQIQFSTKSMMDDFGRVFIKDGKIYRAIHADKEKYCLALIKSPLFEELTRKELIPRTTIADFSIPGYNLILNHEKLTETLQHEWSFSMLKDAAEMILEVNEICNKCDYELKDAHTLNVLFKGHKPMLVDIGSIAAKQQNKGWIAYEEFLASFIIPLLFWSKNEIYITRKLLESNFHRMATIPSQTIPQSKLLNILFPKHKYTFSILNRALFSTSFRWKLISFFSAKTNRLIKLITGKNTPLFSYEDKKGLSDYLPYDKIKTILQSLTTPSLKSTWQGYHQKFYSNNGEIAYSPRFLRILELIKSKEPEIDSIIDLAGNEGYFCFLLKRNLPTKKIILVDYDENAVDVAYNTIKKDNNLNGINTVLLNFMFTPDITGTTKRLKSDMVVSLAVTHHLILTTAYSLPAIFERLKLFSNKYVLVEFMPLGLWATGDTTYPHIPEWYNKEWFREEFEKHFKLIISEQLEENRIAFFGEIIQQ